MQFTHYGKLLQFIEIDQRELSENYGVNVCLLILYDTSIDS